MFALVLVGALLGQTLAAPSNCGTASVCDHYSGRQIAGSGQNNGGYSSYSKWGSSKSWSSGSANGDSAYGTSKPARLETFDEGNVIGTSNPDRAGSWRDQKSYVTDDRKGKIDYEAGQEIKGNTFTKFASTSYRYGSNDHHEVQPNSQIIHHSQFDRQIQDVQRDMQAFMGKFSFGVGSVVSQQTLDSFAQQAALLSNQVSQLCNQASVGSEDYRRLQQIKQNFDAQVQQRQQELMNVAYQSSHSFTGSLSSTSTGNVVGSNQYTRPTYPTQPVYYQPSTISPQVAQAEKIQQECNEVRNDIDKFYRNFVTADYSTYDREDTLAAFRSQVDAEVAAINQQLAKLRAESANFEYQRKFVEDMSATFERYVQNLNQHIEDCEKRIRAEQIRLIEEQERLNKERLEQERRESQQKYEQALLEAQRKREEEERVIKEQQRLEEEKLQQQKLEAEQAWQRQEAERQRLIALQVEQQRINEERQKLMALQVEEQRINEQRQKLLLQQQQQQQQQQQRPQQVSLPQVQTVSPNVEVSQSGGWSHKVDVHVSGSQHHEVSGGIGAAGSTSGQQIHQYQPVQIGPHIDITDMFNKMNQEYNKLVSSVGSLGSYSMQLTESNQHSIDAQFQREVQNLRQNIDHLCQESSQYHNNQILKAAEDLRQNLDQSYEYFKQELAKMSSSTGASGAYQDNSSWQSGGRYTNVRQPHISNVEYSHSKSTEIELSGRHGGAGQQQVNCVEQYANQPCVEPVRVRREAGGYYSQQHESNFDEYTPRRNTHQRRRTYTPESEDYSQQHIDPQVELDDYSQRTGQVELPRDRQRIRSESLRRRGEMQSHNSQQQEQQVEDLTQLEDISQNHYSQRNQHNRPHSSRHGQQETEDLSQQYVQRGHSEDFQSYQKPRRERVQMTPKTPKFKRLEDLDEQTSQVDDRQQRTQQIQAANLQREQSSASTGRTLLDQKLVVDEPQEFVKPIVKPGKLGSARGIDDDTLEKSGFYDNPKSEENSKVNENLQQSYERPSQQQVIETHGKSRRDEVMQKPHILSDADLTLENSGLDEYQQQAVTESSVQQVTTFKNLDNSQKSEDLTLQKSGFFENPGQGQISEQSQISENSELNQQNEDLVHQQSNHQNSFTRDERVGQTVDRDSTQQSAQQVNFGPEFQSGRRSRVNLYDETQRNPSTPASPTQNREYEQRNHHPVGQYIDNLPMQNRPSSVNIIDLGSDELNSQFDNVKSQLDTNLAQSENQETVTAYSPVRPVPKPIPRYTGSRQVSQNVNAPQETENEYSRQSENQNAHIESINSSRNSNEFDQLGGPHRGDLPGHSEPTTEEPVYIPPQTTPAPIARPTTQAPIIRPITQAPIIQPITQAPITEKPSQNIVEPELPTERTPCFYNRCQHNQFGQSGQSYYYHQQNQHNIRFSQSIYNNHNNQLNLGTSSGYQIRNPFYRQNSQAQFNQQVSPVSYSPEGGYTFRYRDQQTNNMRINHLGSTHSSATQETLEQNDLLGLNGQESSQQVQKPTFDNSSAQRGLSQHHSTFTVNQQVSQTSDDGFPARVIPLDETQSRNIWADIESTTRPTFWKRTGDKLSNAYEKVRESSRTIYG